MIARNALALSAATALATLAPLAMAQTDQGLAGSDVIVGLGVAGGFAPAYEGADVYKFQPAPAISLSWGDTLVVENGTIRVAVIKTPWLQAGPLAAWRPGRQEDDSRRRLRGLGDIDDSFDLGAFARVEFGGWSAGIAARQDAVNDGGALVDLTTGYALPLSDSFTLSLGADATWASDDYMAANFGISRRQAQRSDYSEFKAGAAFKNIGVSLGGSYALTERWALGATTGYQRLLGDAADSPIVKQGGSADQYYGFVSVTYRFGL
ncbi:outer membrane scaffolding protein for murein synthesis (MipA/OmpV family) [Inquilinus ginsengisoli]|uniref:Outer membrane scaffolding protein for murein synthesis (MipA/OmpV family) n=1 Tax=Inquilinus ginsengisoli TaxID=363840 RepID=A0ABU1JGI5_9PROT|nr:MipA/OmpV family protein [Inquilinus ginsengisoli]MDR6287733.1 outer membrane scaffolding protein for murein synthesis (MipA/OmpV family) [Inquilinus ginsengisoli]